MKIAVTGANGYIGRHVVSRLIDLGHDVVATDLVTDKIDSRAIVKTVDIFKDDNIFELLDSPEVCIHLAWKDGFIHNSDSHLKMLYDHYAFIKKMVDSGIKHLSVMGTMHEVGYFEGAIDENTPTNPMSLYGIAKDTLRHAVFLLLRDTNVTLTWLRAFYILGDDLNNNSIFSKIIAMDKEGKTSFPFVSGKNKYDFLEVDALANQIALASVQDDIQGIINCCSGQPVSIGDKVSQFIETHHLSIKPEFGVFPEREYDSPAIWGDNTKIKAILRNYENQK
ncbi:NAD(P)-dependent oxidoreductase [Streptococcus iniae]|uniref:NAD-dependent epimerase/dehydratase family protein n=1 Tax=Streptococcus iniae TaxID=1346 RepID=UPI0008DA0C87|nr:NAD(P)-dependent oxidoreductase [Streptococcus iniae]OHX28065.1 nucleoside-diphosphate sugar epimerase [Streptococcus iniae]RLV27695.1 NAD(P)-dependent oxidoreductase [Streptococcus iniae]